MYSEERAKGDWKDEEISIFDKMQKKEKRYRLYRKMIKEVNTVQDILYLNGLMTLRDVTCCLETKWISTIK